MKLIGKCFGCKKNHLFIRKRKIMLPPGLEVLSHEQFCAKCAHNLQDVVKSRP